jgi:hypothetical protein
MLVLVATEVINYPGCTRRKMLVVDLVVVDITVAF